MQTAVVRRGGKARVLFHAFSMVGWSLYSVLLQHAAAARGSLRMADVCGVVIDSAPETTVRAAQHTFVVGLPFWCVCHKKILKLERFH